MYVTTSLSWIAETRRHLLGRIKYILFLHSVIVFELYGPIKTVIVFTFFLRIEFFAITVLRFGHLDTDIATSISVEIKNYFLQALPHRHVKGGLQVKEEKLQ